MWSSKGCIAAAITLYYVTMFAAGALIQGCLIQGEKWIMNDLQKKQKRTIVLQILTLFVLLKLLMIELL